MNKQEKTRPVFQADEALLDRIPYIEDPEDLGGVMTAFLKEIIHWTWTEMMTLQYDPRTLGIHSTVMGIIKLCASGNMNSIKLLLNRLEGKVETPINIIKPKVYLRYPNATNIAELEAYAKEQASQSNDSDTKRKRQTNSQRKRLNVAEMGLGQTVKAMLTVPVDVPTQILKQKMLVEQDMENGHKPDHSPYVKSVIAASIIHNANFDNNYDALQVLLERVEGKVEENIRIIGDDIFIDQYAETAPLGSVLINGQWCFESAQIADKWADGYMSAKKMKQIADGEHYD